MAMFGRTLTPEEKAARNQKIALFGATLQDVGSGLGGSPGDSIQRVQSMFLKQAELAKQKAAQQALDDALLNSGQPNLAVTQGQVPPLLSANGPPRAAPTLRDILPQLLSARRAGLDTSSYTDLLKGLNPGPLKVGANEVVLDPNDPTKALYTNRDPTEGEYTLSAGARRFGPGGKIIAEAPFAPQIVTASPESNVFQVDKNAPAAAPDMGAVDSLIGSLGGRITSATRSPAHNAEVGGVPNSYHLTGQARDVVPPQGVTLAAFADNLKRSLPGYDILNEGDHVHIEPGPRQGGGMRQLQQGQPKPVATVRPATAAEKAVYGISPDVPAQIKPDGSIDVINGTGANLKPVPPKIQEGLISNRSSIAQIDEAIKAIEANKKAMGAHNFLPEEVTQRIDPGGVSVRAKVANIGSLIRHERSGAAVTAAETPVLKPFIPSATDTADTAIKKLREMRRQFENSNNEIEVTYGQDSGYRPMGGQVRPAAPSKASGPPRVKTVAEALKLPPGTKFIGPDGVERVRK